MKITDLSTKSYLFDPLSEDFVEKLLKIKEFQFESKLSKKKLFTYIVLMGDPKSELRTQFPHYGSRKREAAKCSGFEFREGHFPKELENIMVGLNEGFNRAFVRYLSLSYNPVFVQIEFYKQLQIIAMGKSLTGEDPRFIKTAGDITDKLEKLESSVFMGEEVTQMRKALYQQAEQQELTFTPEHIATGLAEGRDFKEFSPYEDGYEIDDMHFLSDEEPKEDISI